MRGTVEEGEPVSRETANPGEPEFKGNRLWGRAGRRGEQLLRARNGVSYG